MDRSCYLFTQGMRVVEVGVSTFLGGGEKGEVAPWAFDTFLIRPLVPLQCLETKERAMLIGTHLSSYDSLHPSCMSSLVSSKLLSEGMGVAIST